MSDSDNDFDNLLARGRKRAREESSPKGSMTKKEKKKPRSKSKERRIKARGNMRNQKRASNMRTIDEVVATLREHATRMPCIHPTLGKGCLILDPEKVVNVPGLSIVNTTGERKIRVNVLGVKAKQFAYTVMYAHHNWDPTKCTHDDIRGFRKKLYGKEELVEKEDDQLCFSQVSDKWSWDSISAHEQKLTYEYLFIEKTYKKLTSPCIMHRCDIGQCIEPSHLKLTSMNENIANRGCIGWVLPSGSNTLINVCTHPPPLCTRATILDNNKTIILNDKEREECVHAASEFKKVKDSIEEHKNALKLKKGSK